MQFIASGVQVSKRIECGETSVYRISDREYTDKKSICALADAGRARYVTSSLDMPFARRERLDISLTRYVNEKEQYYVNHQHS
jgi:hypothetical protein